jgi:hypothetical protein
MWSNAVPLSDNHKLNILLRFFPQVFSRNDAIYLVKYGTGLSYCYRTDIQICYNIQNSNGMRKQP